MELRCPQYDGHLEYPSIWPRNEGVLLRLTTYSALAVSGLLTMAVIITGIIYAVHDMTIFTRTTILTSLS